MIQQEYYDFLVKSVRVFSILSVGYFVGKYIEIRLRKKLTTVYDDKILVNVISRVVLFAIIFMALTTAANELQIDLSALLTTAGVFGVAIGFAAQTSFSNIISGLFLIIEKPFSYNEKITVNGVTGRVISIDFFATTLLTFDNRVVRIPHQKLLKETIVNESRKNKRLFQTNVPLSLDQDFDMARSAVLKVINELDVCLNDPNPIIRLERIESGERGAFINLKLGIWHEISRLGEIKNTFLPALKKEFDQAGIKLG